MRKENAAHFDLVKIHNRRLIRNILREESPQGASRLAEKAGLSYPTVTALLRELLENNEVLINAESESCGGRPGQRYELNAEYQYGLIMYFEDWTLKGIVYDAYAKKEWETSIMVTYKVSIEDIVSFVSSVKDKYSSLSAISIGVPGAVCNSEIIYLPKFSNLEGKDLALCLESKFQIDIFIENDINAVAFAEADSFKNFAHIAYVNDCIGVGIVLNGDVVKGAKGYAGEMEYLCEDLTNQEKTFATSILALTCVLDLPDIIISGNGCSIETVLWVKQLLEQSLPTVRIPEIHIVDDIESKYRRGLLKKVISKWSEDE